MYSVLAGIWEFCEQAVWGYCLYFFCGGFLGKRKRAVLLAVFWCVWEEALARLLEPDYSGSALVLKLAALYGGLFFVAAILYWRSGRRAVFVLATFAAVSEISRFLAYSASLLGNWVYSLDIVLLERGCIRNPDRYLSLLKLQTGTIQLFMNLVFVAGLYGSLRFILQETAPQGACASKKRFFVRKACGEREFSIGRTELAFLLLPECAGLLLCALLRIILVTVEDGMPLFLYDRYPLLIGVAPALLLLCLSSILYSVKLFLQLRELHEERSRRFMLERQLEGMEEQLRETERVYAGVRAMKHDMKNQLAVAAELAAGDGKGEELQAYLAQLNQTLNGLEAPCSTGNAVVDTLISIKYHELRERIPGIVFDAEKLIIPGGLKIRPLDLSLILGNGLDNAMEACEKGVEEPWVRVSSLLKGSYFLLEIANRFNGRLNCPEGSEFPATSKSDAAMHGIGLRSVKLVAAKYGGGVDWTAEDGVFTLTVMLRSR